MLKQFADAVATSRGDRVDDRPATGRKSWDKLSEVPAHRSFRVGRQHLPHDTFGQFISVELIRGVPHQALVMKKATRTAPAAKLVVGIDDDPLILEATGGFLQSWGCCVVTAQSCEEALVRLAKTQAGRRPDVIMSDYRLSRGLTGGRHRKASQRVPEPDSSASHQRRCDLLCSVRGWLPRIPSFVQAGECGEASRGASRRLRAATLSVYS
jgi:hypothetical protein